MSTPECPSPDAATNTQAIDERLISFFQDGVRMLGLPKSLGEIYGVLYCAREPMTMVDIINHLGISKGSASQGLKMLRTLGAVYEVSNPDDRKTYFKADMELKQIVGGFIREEIRPHLKSGKEKLQSLSQEVDGIDDPELKAFYDERVVRLERWSSKANLVLPILQKFLGK